MLARKAGRRVSMAGIRCPAPVQMCTPVRHRSSHLLDFAIVDRLGVRELRNATADAVRRAGNGERIIITVGGKPVAQLGPIEPAHAADCTIDDLIARGQLIAPRDNARPTPDDPVDLWAGSRIDRAAAELRGDPGRRGPR